MSQKPSPSRVTFVGSPRLAALLLAGNLLLWSVVTFLQLPVTGPLLAVLLILAGIVAYALLEWNLHRYMHDYRGRMDSFQILHFEHHADPFGEVPVPWFIAPVFTAALLPGALFFPFAIPFLLGFLLGYAFYDFVHHQAHLRPAHPDFIDHPLLNRLRRHHLIHHGPGRNQHTNFGVISTLLDRIAGTEKQAGSGQFDSGRGG